MRTTSMISVPRSAVLFTALGWILSATASAAQQSASDSSQLVMTLRAPSAAETTNIADPLDARHALALYRALVDTSCSPPSDRFYGDLAIVAFGRHLRYV